MLPGFDSRGQREPSMSLPRLLVHEDADWQWELERKGLVVRLEHKGNHLDWAARLKLHQVEIEATRPWLMQGWLKQDMASACVYVRTRREALEQEARYTANWIYSRVYAGERGCR